MGLTRTGLLVTCYALAALMWALPTLHSTVLRLSYRDLIDAIRVQDAGVNAKVVVHALSQYERALRFAPCDSALLKDYILLQGYQADDSAHDESTTEMDAELVQTQQAIGALLACRPTDGKAWLDYAVINFEREGFSKRTRAAYQMSWMVTPNESWLAHKRAIMALNLRPMFDATMNKIALSDLDTLHRANPYRLTELMKATKLYKLTELQALFTVQPETPKPSL